MYWPSPRHLDDEGNHLGDPLTTWFRHKRIETDNTHGTGCTLSSAIACALAQGMDLADAVNPLLLRPSPRVLNGQRFRPRQIMWQ